MLAEGATVVKDPEAGDYTVTINSPQAKAALDLYIDLLKRCGPPNYGSLGQGDVIQLLVDRQGRDGRRRHRGVRELRRSGQVGGRRQARDRAAARARSGGERRGDRQLEHRSFRRTCPDAQKKAALAFSRWFLTYDAQRAFAEAGGIPNRSDVYTSDLAKQPRFRWMPAYLETQKFAKQELGYAEGAQVEQILGLRLNQALIGEMSSGKALNLAAKEIEDLFRKNGRKTGALPPLPE